MSGEDDIEDYYKKAMKECFGIDVTTKIRQRGKKGEYKDLISVGSTKEIRKYLFEEYGGLNKADRQVPQQVYSWNREAKLFFLGGIIDADGYINKHSHGGSTVQIGSTNKELSLQQMSLAQALGMQAKIYPNKYNKKDPEATRYRVEFNPTEELISAIRCKKKRDNYIPKDNEVLYDSAFVKNVSQLSAHTAYSYDVETESDYFEVSGIYSHNCRTRVFENLFGEKTSIGRGNLSFTTINIVKLAIECMTIKNKNDRLTEFFIKLDEMLNLTAKQLDDRFNFQKTALAKQFPLLMSSLWNGCENLKQDDTIESVINQGTLSIGFIGLAECLTALIGKHHGESDEAQELGIRIVDFMSGKAKEFSNMYFHNYSILATPAEGLSGRFTAIDKKQFGVIEGVTDKDYYTNSNHIPVHYKCTAEKKAKLEAPYHPLTRAGHIFYVELDGDATHNPKAIMTIVDLMDKYDIGYGSANHNRNRCTDCGHENAEKELKICPECGSENIDCLQRITGYLVGTTSRWNNAKLAELGDRVQHGV